MSNPEEEDKDSSDTESESEHDSVTSEKNDTEKWIKNCGINCDHYLS